MLRNYITLQIIIQIIKLNYIKLNYIKIILKFLRNYVSLSKKYIDDNLLFFN